MTEATKIGILFSTSGPYGSMGRDAVDGAALAIRDLAQAAGVFVELRHFDPQGDLSAYLEGARQLLGAGCRHIVGTITSAARKEVIPLVEKHDCMLWYTCPYEGFEANENVIYLGGCPNQHLVPLFDHLLPRYGANPYLVGANYVWGWEMNRLARELVTQAGGVISGERYLPFEERDVGRIIAEIAERKPSFVLNNLIGPASYALLEAMGDLGRRDPTFSPDLCPVVSCDLMECELADIRPGSVVGQLCAASYFDSVANDENIAFKTRVAALHGAGRRVSSIYASTYCAVTMLAGAIAAAGGDDPEIVRREVHGRLWAGPLGALSIDRDTNHAALPFQLGRINANNGFDVLLSRPPLAADPYLTGARRGSQPKLRVVS